MSDCLNTNIPTVDNTALPCEKYIDQDCIVLRSGFPFIGIVSGKNIGEVLTAIVDKMTLMDKEIKELKEILDNNNIH